MEVNDIYTLEIVATEFPKKEYPMPIEKKSWTAVNEEGKDRLLKIKDEVLKVWKKIYGDDRDIEITWNLYINVVRMNLILNDYSIDMGRIYKGVEQ